MPKAIRPKDLTYVLGWAAVGLLVVIVVQILNVSQIDGLANTLRLGVESPGRPVVEEQLGEIGLAEGTGHDGHHFYLVGLDPFATDKGRLDLYSGYRHRRLFLPLLAGSGGLVDGRALLYGLTILNGLGMAFAAGAMASIGRSLGARAWVPIGVVANVGLLNSVQLMTGDTVAVGLGLAAFALAVSRRNGWAVALLVAAALTKETSILFAVGVSAHLVWRKEYRSALLATLIPTAAVIGWAGYIDRTIGDGFSTQGNLSAPIVGIAESITLWTDQVTLVLGTVALLGLAIALVGASMARTPSIWHMTAPWVLVALISSPVVWGDGNNALRVFSILWATGILGLGVAANRRQPALVSAP